MFQYGIDIISSTVIFVISIIISVFAAFIYEICLEDSCVLEVKFIKPVVVFFITFNLFFGFGFYGIQKDHYCEQSVKAVLNENYPGYKEFKDKNYGDNEENSFIYKKAKYAWEYDKSDKKLTVIYYGVPREDAVFINGEKQENGVK